MDHQPESSDVRSRVRREDRAVTNEPWIASFLAEAPYGVLGTEADGQPFLTPLTFVYDAETHSLYFHGGRGGRLFHNANANPRACFNACRLGGIVSGAGACKFDVEYDSVTVFGLLTILEAAEESARALSLLAAKYGAEAAEQFPAGSVARTAVYRLAIDEWSGKRSPARPR